MIRTIRFSRHERFREMRGKFKARARDTLNEQTADEILGDIV